jgi:DNA-binding transcriptional regulator YiaG
LLPPAVRAIDRLRALFTAQPRITPGFIISLRETLGLTQEQFAGKLGVAKMTVSRWECGRMRPGPAMVAAILDMRARARRRGVKIEGDVRPGIKRSA